MSSDSSDDDEDYAFGEATTDLERRYPIHDACEFEEIETLRVSAVPLER
jgi:hypothetical protein